MKKYLNYHCHHFRVFPSIQQTHWSHHWNRCQWKNEREDSCLFGASSYSRSHCVMVLSTWSSNCSSTFMVEIMCDGFLVCGWAGISGKQHRRAQRSKIAELHKQTSSGTLGSRVQFWYVIHFCEKQNKSGIKPLYSLALPTIVGSALHIRRSRTVQHSRLTPSVQFRW